MSSGSGVNLRTEKGGSALHAAVGMGNLDICAYLMDSEANIEATDREGKTPLQRAVKIDKAGLGDRKEIIHIKETFDRFIDLYSVTVFVDSVKTFRTWIYH